MKITKYGHNCILLEINDSKILIDPGFFTDKSAVFENIDLILISHAHFDHLDKELLQSILSDNPALIWTNSEIVTELATDGIQAEVIEEGEEKMYKNIKIKAYGKLHQEVYPGISAGPNTAFMVNDEFFYPGDSYLIPDQKVGVLAMPVSGPWVKLEDAINYAIKIKPKSCFPVHDGMLVNPGIVHVLPAKVLEQHGIKFLPLEIGKQTLIN